MLHPIRTVQMKIQRNTKIPVRDRRGMLKAIQRYPRYSSARATVVRLEAQRYGVSTVAVYYHCKQAGI